jgi:hypothetical protein
VAISTAGVAGLSGTAATIVAAAAAAAIRATESTTGLGAVTGNVADFAALDLLAKTVASIGRGVKIPCSTQSTDRQQGEHHRLQQGTREKCGRLGRTCSMLCCPWGAQSSHGLSIHVR